MGSIDDLSLLMLTTALLRFVLLIISGKKMLRFLKRPDMFQILRADV